MSDVVLSFCDLTGKFVDPWVEYGYTAILVDPQHETGVSYDNRVIRVGHIIDHPETWSVVKKHIDRLAFVAGFPPCTDVAVSGSRWFEDKRKADPFFQTKAALVAEQCRVVGQLSGAPWFFENPVSVFSSIFGKPTHTHSTLGSSTRCARRTTTPRRRVCGAETGSGCRPLVWIRVCLTLMIEFTSAHLGLTGRTSEVPRQQASPLPCSWRTV